MAGPAQPAANASAVLALVGKMSDPDPDYRFMALNDIHSIFTSHKTEWMAHEYNTAARTLDGIVKALDDNVGEVQNLAIKCLEPFTRRCPLAVIAPMLEKLSTMKQANTVDNSVVSMALRTVIHALPKPVPGGAPTQATTNAYTSISRVLIPRFVGKVVDPVNTNIRLPNAPANALLDSDSQPNSDTVDILIEVVACFGPMLSVAEVSALVEMVIKLIEDDKSNSVVKKRAVVALSLLAPYLQEQLLAQLMQRIEHQLTQPNVNSTTRRYLLSVVGSLSRSIPTRFASYLNTFVPLLITALGEEELQSQLELISEGDAGDAHFGDVREAALATLESLLAACPHEMCPYTDETIAACLRYLKYDPNYAQDDDDEEMDEDEEDDFGADEDDEFEDDAGFDDDDDDASWKVRRCAAKALYTLISTRGSGDLLENGVLYRDAAPTLIKRFDEREESVRLEVVSSMALLIRKTGEGVLPLTSFDDDNQLELLSKLPQSRKRRRQSSTVGMLAIDTSAAARAALSGTGVLSPELEKLPTSGPRADLARVTPALVKAVTKQFKGKLVGTKQAVVNLLNDLVNVQRSGLAAYFDQLVTPILDAIKLAGTSSASISLTGAASATPSTLRIAALQLTGGIARTHSSNVLQPYISKLVDACILAVNDKFFKISSEALKAVEELVKAITPPRSSSTCQEYKADILKVFDVICERSDSSNADTEVRQRAIHALGTLLSRTSNQDGSMLVPGGKREAALASIFERLKNETTRPAAIKAISNIAALSSPAVPINLNWAQPVALELAAQLRKSNRVIRSSSIQALSNLVQAPGVRGSLEKATVSGLTNLLQPALSINDALLLAPATIVLSKLAETAPDVVITDEMNASLCQVLMGSVSTVALDAILQLVTCIGKKGHGDKLLGAILKDVSVRGDPAVVGKVIGTLLVSSSNPSVSVNDFVDEVKRTRHSDPARASLALAVLGEAGFRLGPQNPIEPTYFMGVFGTEPNKQSVAAAIAMGRACAGNVSKFLPVILNEANQGGNVEYLLLQAIKETLQVLSSTQATGDYTMYWEQIWAKLVTAAQAQDNRPACAECMGRLCLIEPTTYIAKLESLLQSPDNVIRAVAVQALRYTLPESDGSFDALLKIKLVPTLVRILQDQDLEIRRLAMSTLTSATHNKPDLIVPSLGKLMPYVMEESRIKPELLHEVSLGPFKHTVDDGLELRKAAYETLYALMEVAFSRISNISFFDRVVDGIKDDSDIRGLCNLMLRKLVILDFEETVRRLAEISIRFRHVLSVKLKDNAVKQEVEKQEETNKSILRVTLLLDNKTKAAAAAQSAGGGGNAWIQYVEWVNSTFANQLPAIREENRADGTLGTTI
ncbi:Cullin-associated NEDD8-dissociated protein 1 C-terminal part [Zalerion maritima]|uniref:Cullin-associated NEDD8-dissociated protein 1 C-terminal part n=1 Tax=Zalerion maritima TaxID=339359 RepID=A0AAD5RQY3_9PEZI|nr:Cullin-associated NEDD8-dissociated protein 1 C-terminal part [Zalerion maritima]